jgi:hypothetical protein
MFPHHNTRIYTWTSPDRKTRILVDRRRHSNVPDARSYSAADCDTDHYLVVANVRGRLLVNKQRSYRFHMERFNLKNLNEVEGEEKFCVEISNRFAALEDLDIEMEINSVWELITDNIKIPAKERIGYYKLRKHKPWINERCSKFLDQKKQAKLQWLQDLSEGMSII